MKSRICTTILLTLIGAFASATPAFSQGTAFTYQGRLNNGGNAAGGIYDLRFTLYDSTNLPGVVIAGPLTNSSTGVSNGLFTVALDFGAGVFPGADRWLEIAVRTNNGGAFTALAPRQQLTPTPYAITAANVTPGAGLSGTYGGAVTLNNSANQFTGSFTGNGANVTNVNALTLGGLSAASFWKIAGNAGTTAGANFVGTTDNQPLELRVNGQRALRLEPGLFGALNILGGSGSVGANSVNSFIGGGAFNSIGTTNYFATIAGGNANSAGPFGQGVAIGGGDNNSIGPAGFDSTIAGGYHNSIGTNDGASIIAGGYSQSIGDDNGASTISGGTYNSIATDVITATIAGGWGNQIGNNGSYSSISGGYSNSLSRGNATIGGGSQNLNNGDFATIAGGQNNLIEMYAYESSIGGGFYNTIQSNATYSTVSGGYENWIYPDASQSTIAGGYINGIETNANDSTVSGGTLNFVYAPYAVIGGGRQNQINGNYGTIPGGNQNVAGTNAFAAGHRAKANHTGAFVWADSTDADFASTANDQFNVRANGGVRFVAPANANGAVLELKNDSGSPTLLGAINFNNSVDAFPGQISYTTADSGLHFRAGGVERMFVNASGLTVNGTFVSASDRNVKENFKAVDAQEILGKVAALPVSRWNYKEDRSSEHIGPMAQDFYSAFGVGPDDKHIATIDEGGVALAAIQGLNRKVEKQAKALETKDAQIAELEQRLERLEKMVSFSPEKR